MTLIFFLDGVEVHSKSLSLQKPENIEKYSQMKRDENMVCVSRLIDSGFVRLRFVYECDRQKYFQPQETQAEIVNPNTESSSITTIDV